MRSKVFRALIACVLLLLAGIAANAQAKPGAVSGDVVKIGVLTDLSGVYSDLSGQGSVVAAQMAIDQFGGKVLGKPIQLLSADHLNKPDVGATKAREWYDSGVDAIFDVPTSSVAIAVNKVAGEKHRLFIDSTAGATSLVQENCNPYFVHYTYDTYATGGVTGRAVVQHGGKTWFFITADYAFGHSLRDDTSNAVKAAGGQVLGDALHPLNAPDFSSYILKAQASKAQVIGLANAGGDTINSIKAAAEFGINKSQRLAGLLVFDTDIHSLGLQLTQGMYVASPYYWDMNNDTRKFGQAFFAKAKKMPTFVQAGVYSSVLTYLKAVKAAGTDNPDAVMKQLKSMTINDDVFKNGKIRPDGLMVKEFYLFQVKSPSESKGPWDIYKLVGSVPPDQAFPPMSKKCSLVK